MRLFEQSIIASSKLEADKQEATLEYEMAVRELRFCFSPSLPFPPRCPPSFSLLIPSPIVVLLARSVS